MRAAKGECVALVSLAPKLDRNGAYVRGCEGSFQKLEGWSGLGLLKDEFEESEGFKAIRVSG